MTHSGYRYTRDTRTSPHTSSIPRIHGPWLVGNTPTNFLRGTAVGLSRTSPRVSHRVRREPSHRRGSETANIVFQVKRNRKWIKIGRRSYMKSFGVRSPGIRSRIYTSLISLGSCARSIFTMTNGSLDVFSSPEKMAIMLLFIPSHCSLLPGLISARGVITLYYLQQSISFIKIGLPENLEGQ